MSVSKKAILKALIDGVITELMVKTNTEQVYIDESTTLTAKLAEMIAAINLRAKTTDVETMINELKQELLGDVPVEAYDTFTELAAYIEEHEEVAESITAAIGNKADKSVVEDIQATLSTLGALATKDIVTESDLDPDLVEMINSGGQASHSHTNKEVLDTITSEKVTNWDAAATSKHIHSNQTVLDGITSGDISSWNTAGNDTHTHSNKTVIDGITSTKVTNWDAAATNNHSHDNKEALDSITVDKISAWDSKSAVHVGSTEPTELTAGDLWFHVTN